MSDEGTADPKRKRRGMSRSMDKRPKRQKHATQTYNLNGIKRTGKGKRVDETSCHLGDTQNNSNDQEGVNSESGSASEHEGAEETGNGKPSKSHDEEHSGGKDMSTSKSRSGSKGKGYPAALSHGRDRTVTVSSSESISSPSPSSDSSSSPSSSSSSSSSISPAIPAANSSTSAPRLPGNQYELPHGFGKVSNVDHFQAGPGMLFKESYLTGKEIWHITTPASVPLSSVSIAATSKFKKGDMVITHGGIDYSLAYDKGSTARVLVPDESGSTYRFTPTRVHLSSSLKRVPAPSDDLSREDQSRDTVFKVKEIPQQPPNLRARFWPAGFEGEVSEGLVARVRSHVPIKSISGERSGVRATHGKLHSTIQPTIASKSSRRAAPSQTSSETSADSSSDTEYDSDSI